MKRLSIFLFIVVPMLAFAQGVDFNHGSWAEILEKAKSEKKLIFVDAYTTWCGPCKMMSNQTFPNKEVGDFYNARFVNAKIDMEKGEGVDLAKKYFIQAYPTLLFIDGDGEVIHRTAGFHGVKEFIDLGKTALEPSRSLKGLQKKYQKGDRTPEFLSQYTEAKFMAMDPTYTETAEEYLKTQGDWGSEKNMEFIFKYAGDPMSPSFAYLVKNKAAFERKYEMVPVNSRIEETFNGYLAEHPGMALEDIDKLFMTVYPQDGPRLSSAYRMTRAREAGDREGYAKAAVAHYKKFPSSNYEELNETAWTFYQNLEDKKMLKQAVKWAKKSVKLNDAYFNNDTLAALYLKLGKKKQGIKAASHSIELAKKAGEDYSGTQEILDQLYKL